MAGRWEKMERAVLAALAALLLAMALPGGGAMEALPRAAALLPGGVWGLLFPLGQLLWMGLGILAGI